MKDVLISATIVCLFCTVALDLAVDYVDVFHFSYHLPIVRLVVAIHTSQSLSRAQMASLARGS